VTTDIDPYLRPPAQKLASITRLLKGGKLMGLRQLRGWETSGRPVDLNLLRGFPAFDNQGMKASNHLGLTKATWPLYREGIYRIKRSTLFKDLC
jgi:hypothetical protein